MRLQLPIADGILQSVDLGVHVMWSEKQEAAVAAGAEPEVLFKRGERLWKADIGPVRPTYNMVSASYVFIGGICCGACPIVEDCCIKLEASETTSLVTMQQISIMTMHAPTDLTFLFFPIPQNPTSAVVKKELRWGSAYFSRLKNPHGHVPKRGYPKVQLLQRVAARVSDGSAAGEWTVLKVGVLWCVCCLNC